MIPSRILGSIVLFIVALFNLDIIIPILLGLVAVSVIFMAFFTAAHFREQEGGLRANMDDPNDPYAGWS
jgi:hypothetical protein